LKQVPQPAKNSLRQHCVWAAHSRGTDTAQAVAISTAAVIRSVFIVLSSDSIQRSGGGLQADCRHS
jgi:hypothetical protein